MNSSSSSSSSSSGSECCCTVLCYLLVTAGYTLREMNDDQLCIDYVFA